MGFLEPFLPSCRESLTVQRIPCTCRRVARSLGRTEGLLHGQACSPGQACLRQILNQKYINWFQSCIIIGTQFMYNFGACKGLARRHQNPETEPHPENVVFAIENASF